MRLRPEDLFAGYPDHPEITEEHRANAEACCLRVNALLDDFEADGNAPLEASPATGTLLSLRGAGWRPQNAAGARFSSHKLGGAVDLHDPDKRLDDWIMRRPKVMENNNRAWPDVLVSNDLYMEHPDATAGQVTKGGWCHLASIGPRSGNRVFYP